MMSAVAAVLARSVLDALFIPLLEHLAAEAGRWPRAVPARARRLPPARSRPAGLGLRAEFQAVRRCAGAQWHGVCASRRSTSALRWCWCCRRASATRRAPCSPAPCSMRCPGRGAGLRAECRGRQVGPGRPGPAGRCGWPSVQAQMPQLLDPAAGRPRRPRAAGAVARAGCAAAQRRRLHESRRAVRLGSHRYRIAAAGRPSACRSWRAGRRPRRGLRLSRQPAGAALRRHHRAGSVRGRAARAGAGARQPRRGACRPAAGRSPPRCTGTTSPAACRGATTPSSAIRRSTKAVPTSPNWGGPSLRRQPMRCCRTVSCGWSPIAICPMRPPWHRRFNEVRAVVDESGFKVITARGVRA